jgi:hypothetical protein
VKDRVLGHKADAQHPDQGGSSFYIDSVHYFPNGFLAAADVNITSNLAFRQVFSDSIQQAISPEERSQVFINKSYRAYSFNFRMNSQATSLQNSQIRIRELPSVTFDRRPSIVRWLKKLPVYLSWESGVEGVSRKETAPDLALFRLEAGRDPIFTPSIVQRFDFHPVVSLPLSFAGWSLTATGGLRATTTRIRSTQLRSWCLRATSCAVTESLNWTCGRRRWRAIFVTATAQSGFRM